MRIGVVRNKKAGGETSAFRWAEGEISLFRSFNCLAIKDRYSITPLISTEIDTHRFSYFLAFRFNRLINDNYSC
jgi:hypothetical protein